MPSRSHTSHPRERGADGLNREWGKTCLQTALDAPGGAITPQPWESVGVIKPMKTLLSGLRPVNREHSVFKSTDPRDPKRSSRPVCRGALGTLREGSGTGLGASGTRTNFPAALLQRSSTHLPLSRLLSLNRYGTGSGLLSITQQVRSLTYGVCALPQVWRSARRRSCPSRGWASPRPWRPTASSRRAPSTRRS